MAIKKVPISFKEREKTIYDFLQGKLSPSIYVKELLLREMGKEEQPKENKSEDRKELIDVDF